MTEVPLDHLDSGLGSTRTEGTEVQNRIEPLQESDDEEMLHLTDSETEEELPCSKLESSQEDECDSDGDLIAVLQDNLHINTCP